MSLDITLIFVKSKPRRGTRIKHFMVPPTSLQLLSALTPEEHSLRLIDEYHHPASPDLRSDLVGISVWTASSERAYELADGYRRRGIPVVLGGPHVSVCAEEAQEHADAIVVGEAESVWRQVLLDAEAGKLQPVYHGEMLSLDMSPSPDWGVVNENDYAIRTSITTTRGCVRRCDFCTESSRPKPNFRQRSLDLVLEEIEARPSLVIAFLDNDIMANRRYSRELLKALVPMQRYWLGMTSIEIADDEKMLDLMAESGCRTLFVGFESVNPDSLLEVQKHCNRVETYLRNVKRIHERGIMVNGSFVFGFDNDDVRVFDHTVDFGIEACLETATFTILTPYPGTKLYQRLEAEGRISDRNWSHYDTTRVVYEPAGMSVEELEWGYLRAYEKFYAWKSILQRCRLGEPGFAKRLFLNLAYKRVDPLYNFLGNPIPIGRLRFLFNWYARPFGQNQKREREMEVVFPGD